MEGLTPWGELNLPYNGERGCATELPDGSWRITVQKFWRPTAPEAPEEVQTTFEVTLRPDGTASLAARSSPEFALEADGEWTASGEGALLCESPDDTVRIRAEALFETELGELSLEADVGSCSGG